MLQLRVFGTDATIARYLLLMGCAGIIAGLGVIYDNGILVVGLFCAGAVAGVMTLLLDATDLLPKGFRVGESSLLTGMSTVNASTVLVAAAAGVAGMLALETRASSAVGVAISVTTIPASAYLGVAAGIHEADKVEGALLVLAVNVAMLLAGGCVVLVAQRKLAPRLPGGTDQGSINPISEARATASERDDTSSLR